ncbi:MAG: DUF1415 family protein [Lewinella sp.]
MTPAEQTMDWVRNFVIRHGLCPFAALPFEQGRVVAVPIEALNEEAAFYAALTQVQKLVEAQSEVETTLLVFPAILADFDTFLDFVYTFEEALAETGADELVQLAHFHPNYQFEGVAADDPGNRTNRSPFPVLQLLRVESVAAAVAGYPDVEGIPERNVLLMRSLH